MTKWIHIQDCAVSKAANEPGYVQALKKAIFNAVHRHPLVDREAELQYPDWKPYIESKSSRDHSIRKKVNS
jgi:hypothetical protein